MPSCLERVLHAREDPKELADECRGNMQVSKHVIHRGSTDQDTRTSAEASSVPALSYRVTLLGYMLPDGIADVLDDVAGIEHRAP